MVEKPWLKPLSLLDMVVQPLLVFLSLIMARVRVMLMAGVLVVPKTLVMGVVVLLSI
jgi:hypothetical protein